MLQDIFKKLANLEPLDQIRKNCFSNWFSIRFWKHNFENTLEGLLENKLGWKTSNTNNSFSIEGFDIRFNESEKYKGYEGIIRFTDLRTGKRIGYYEFEAEKFDNVIANVLDYMDYISEAR